MERPHSLRPVEQEYKALIASMMSDFYHQRPTEAAHHARHLSTESQESTETVRPANIGRGQEDLEAPDTQCVEHNQLQIGATEADAGQVDQLRRWILELPVQSGSVRPCTSCAFR